MLDKVTTYFLTIADQERHQIWLWNVVSFLGGIVFSYAYFNQDSFYIYCGLALAVIAVILLYCNRFSYRGVIYWLSLFFVLGFVWMSFYQKYVIVNHHITGKIYAQVEGTISEIKHYEGSASVIMVHPKIYQATSHKKTQKKKSKKKTRNISEKQIQKTFLNIEQLQAINRQSQAPSQHFQNVEWFDDGTYKILPNPPHKISLYIRGDHALAVGDKIAVTTLLEPLKHKEFINGFDQSLYGTSKKIGAYGRALGEVKIMQKAPEKSIDQWRKTIAHSIDQHLQGNVAATAKALLIGQRNLISKEQLTTIRQAGLAHLLAISGLHMAIMAGIFFAAIRFILVRISAWHIDNKKLAAVIAIIGCYVYLLLVGSPISAIRSFIMIALVLSAIVIDRKADLKRSIALAALVLLIINPYHAFMVSFWLSFAAILSLACFHLFISRFKPDDVATSRLMKFSWYFAEIILASIIVQIATAPFLIFTFKQYATLGIVANMFAIPMMSFVVMPLGFVSLLLMPLGLEAVPMQWMGMAIEQILYMCTFISSFQFAYFDNIAMPFYAFIMAITSWIVLCLANSKIKWYMAPCFILSFIPIFFARYPDISFDSQQRFFAIYDAKEGLVFSKKLRKSRNRELWMQHFNQKEFRYIQDERCDNAKCLIKTPSGTMLILTGRNDITTICTIDADLIINLNARYHLPQCFANKNIIDTPDFHAKGSHFIYYKQDGFEIKTAR